MFNLKKKKQNDKDNKNLLIFKYHFDVSKLIFTNIKIDLTDNYTNIVIENQKETLDLSSSLLLPIYITDKIGEKQSKRNKFTEHIYDISFDSKQTSIDLLMKTHTETLFADTNYTKCYTDMQVLLLRHIENKWHKFYRAYGAVKYKCPGLYTFKLGKNTYLFSNKNGKIKKYKDETMYYFDQFMIDKFGIAPGVFWKEIRNISHLPCSREKEIIENNGEYFYFENERNSKVSKNIVNEFAKHKIIKLTNWTGCISRSFTDSVGDLCWELMIGDIDIPLFPHNLCCAKDFQKALSRKGMYFFFGNDNQLKVLLAYLHRNMV